MELNLTQEQEMTKSMVRELAANEIEPIAAEIDESGRFPREIMEKIAEAGLFGILIPPPFGGAGGTRLDLLLTIEELSIASAAIGWSFATNAAIQFMLLAFGNDQQKEKYLPAMAKGEKIAAYGLVEPSGGTNWAHTLRTRAVADGDHYVINGSKCFTSNAGEADLYVVMTRTEPEKGMMGFSYIIIEKDTPGFSFGRIEDKFGLRADPTGELFFEDCRVPKANLINEEGSGFRIFQAISALDCASGDLCFRLCRPSQYLCWYRPSCLRCLHSIC